MHAILQLTKEIYESFDKKQFTIGVFLDLSKAFDTVNHDILLNKLTSFGIQGSYIDWFKSYLHNRQQYISYDNKNIEKWSSWYNEVFLEENCSSWKNEVFYAEIIIFLLAK